MDKTATVIHRVFALLSFKQITLYILLLLCGLNANAQATYPVQVYTQLTPPYTSYLPAYYSGINQKLKVTLINTDMQQPSVSVYLRMQIKSSAFTIQTPENVYTDRIELQAGVPVQLSLDDLAVYFKSENMRISGARNEFLRTQMLPDNFYRFNFEVYESNTHRLLSNPRLGFAQAMIASGEPPILNLPFKGTAIAEQNIPSIMFSWTPRHMNSVASAYGTEYEITLVEIFDKQVAPEAAFDYSRPIYTETTRATSFIHTAAQPMLIPGMRYAWRVRAVAREGVEEANIFKNNGYSPISWFDYTVDCKQVEQSAVVIEGRVATVTWTKTDAVDYEVQYRKKGSNRWYTGSILNDACPIYNLKFGEKYEYRIGVRCTMNDAFIYTDAKGFVMPEELAYSKNCGIPSDINLTNQTPTRELQAKLPILVGDFPVFITKVSGSGRFTGEGYVGIPYLKNAKIAVTFKDIVVNTDNRLISGFIETKYDINKNMIFDGDEFLTGGKGVGDIRTGEERAAYEVPFNIDASKPAVVKPFDDKSEDDIRAAEDYITSKGENPQYIITVIDENGNPQKIGVGEVPTTIKDGADKIYEVDKDGNIKQVSSKSDIVLDDRTKNIQDTTYVSFISFEKTDATKYALDQYKEIYSKVTEYDQEYKVGDTDAIRVSAKFMLPSTTDEIFVRVKPKKDFNPNRVSFIAENKTKYEAKYNGKDGWNLTVVAPEVNDGQLIYVVHEHDLGEGEVVHKTMAILKVVTYEPLSRSVTLVPVNGHNANLNTSQLEKEVNDIYGQIGIEWTVNVLDKQFNYTPINKSTFNVTGSGLFSTKTDDMQAINKAFQDSVYYQEDGLYLFMLDYGASDKGELDGTSGDMPLKSQFGYLFSKPDTRTVAHELGHGAFNLEHPFSRPGRNSFPMHALKDNLMDYAGGKEFAKLQWDQTRKPGHVFGIFQKDKDGKSISYPKIRCISDEDAKLIGKIFFDPEGNIVKLKNNQTPKSFFAASESDSSLRGRLATYKQGGQTYIYYLLDGNYSGYWGAVGLGSQSDANNLHKLDKLVDSDESLNISIEDKYIIINSKKVKLDDCPFAIQHASSKDKDGGLSYKQGGRPKSNGDLGDSDHNTFNNAGNFKLVDFSKTLSDEEFTKLQEFLDGIEGSTGAKVTVYIIDRHSSKYEQEIKIARADENGIVYIKGNNYDLQVDYIDKTPKWLVDLLPDFNVAITDCYVEYINSSLAALKETSKYKDAIVVEKIGYEVGVFISSGILGTLKCITDEESAKDMHIGGQFVMGAVNAAIDIVDIPSMCIGLVTLKDKYVESSSRSVKAYVDDIKLSIQEAKADPKADKVIIMKRILSMPGYRQTVDFATTTMGICENLVTYYGDCNQVSFNNDGMPNEKASTYNLCSYRIGFTAVIVVPIIYTAGEMSITLVNKAKYARLLNVVNLSEDAIRILNKAKLAGNEITYSAGKIVIKNGDEITSITRKAGQVEILTTGAKVTESILNAFKSRLAARFSQSKGFKLIHTDKEISSIIEKGKALGLADNVIDDFVYISCRTDKQIPANELMTQMDNWVNVVSKRGYPYKFSSIEEFIGFKNDLKNGLNEIGLPTNDVRLQGSAVRSSTPKDLDLAVILDHTEMNNAIKNAYATSIRKEGQVVNITEYTEIQLRNLANDINNTNKNIYNAKARDFVDRLTNRRLWPDEYPGLKNLRDNHLKNKYGDINITIQESNSTKSLNPYLELK